MPEIEQRVYVLRTKAALTNDGPWGGLTHPGSTDRATPPWSPCQAVYAYVVPLNVGGTPVADNNNGSFTLSPIYMSDIGNNGAVDATDIAVRGEAQTSCPYYSMVRVPMRGALQFSVELTSFTGNPTGATQVRVYFSCSAEGHGA